MSENWPPEGHSEPEPYEVSNWWVIGIGLALLVPVYELAHPAIGVGTSNFTAWAFDFGASIGMADYALAYVLVVFVSLIGWVLVAGAIIIAIHESVHYAINAILGLNPRFEWHSQLYLKNPSVVAYDDGIRRWENIASLLGPFVILTILCAAVMWATSGFLAATAAIMFSVNAVPSCSDIYNAGRIARMPRGTLFANFDEEEGLLSEYATPKSSGAEST